MNRSKLYLATLKDVFYAKQHLPLDTKAENCEALKTLLHMLEDKDECIVKLTQHILRYSPQFEQALIAKIVAAAQENCDEELRSSLDVALGDLGAI